MDQEEINKYIKAGRIAGELKKFFREYIKKDMLLKEIAKKIEEKIEEKNAIPAFPPTLSIDDVAAHHHPGKDEETRATGILKIDFGISIDGCIADTAFSIDLTPDNKYKELINSTDEALKNAIELLEKDPSINEIGKIVQETIEKKGFSPIVNLSGHSLSKYDVHAGVTIPNYANGNNNKLEPGAYAIEPFATTGEGKIYAGSFGNIYQLVNEKNPRSPKAREILNYVKEKYKTLPFSATEIQEKFGPISKLALSELEKQEIIHSHNTLIEKSHKPVSQSEHTVLIIEKNGKREIIVTTKED